MLISAHSATKGEPPPPVPPPRQQLISRRRHNPPVGSGPGGVNGDVVVRRVVHQAVRVGVKLHRQRVVQPLVTATRVVVVAVVVEMETMMTAMMDRGGSKQHGARKSGRKLIHPKPPKPSAELPPIVDTPHPSSHRNTFGEHGRKRVAVAETGRVLAVSPRGTRSHLMTMKEYI